jgi:hypothetical protein
MRGVVIAGFGGFLAHGGAALYQYALEAAGADEREATVRVSALGGMEHGMLSLIGTVAAIVLLAMGSTTPPLDFSLPWAVIPVPVFSWPSGSVSDTATAYGVRPDGVRRRESSWMPSIWCVTSSGIPLPMPLDCWAWQGSGWPKASWDGWPWPYSAFE